jgi:hypothetical protein
VDLSDLDSLLGQPKRSHVLGSHRVVMTDVVKEGKTIVSPDVGVPYSLIFFANKLLHLWIGTRR